MRMRRGRQEHGAVRRQALAGAAVSAVTRRLTDLPGSSGEPQTPSPDSGSQGLSSSTFFTSQSMSRLTWQAWQPAQNACHKWDISLKSWVLTQDYIQILPSAA